MRKNSLINDIIERADWQSFFLATGWAISWASIALVYYFEVPHRGLIILLLLLFQLFFGSYLILHIMRKFNSLHKTLDELTHQHSTKRRDKNTRLLKPFYVLIENLEGQLKELTGQIKKLGSDELALSSISADSIIGQTLLTTNSEFRALNEQEEQRKWKAEGLAEFAKLVRNTEADDFGAYGFRLISYIVKYLKCNQAGLYIAREDEKNQTYLETLASIAWDKRKFEQRRIYANDGLLGQAMLEKTTLYLIDIPVDYVYITSGIGKATPKNLVIVPMVVNDEVHGAIEIASFNKMKEHEVALLEEFCSTIGHSFDELKTNQKTKRLLEESRNLTAEIQSREEEMRQNMEELEATQEEMQRSKVRMDSIFQALDNTLAMTEFDLEGRLISANSNMLSICDCTLDRLKESAFRHMFGNIANFEKVKEEVLADGLHVGEYRLMMEQKTIWLSANISAERNKNGDLEKLLMLANEITTEKALEAANKEKQNEIDSYLKAIEYTIASCQFDKRGNILYVNEIFASVMGYSSEEFTQKTYLSLMPAAERDKPQTSLMWQSLKDGKHFAGEFKMEDKEGKEQYLAGSFTPIKSLTTGEVKILMLAQFITHEKEKENVLNGYAKSLKNIAPMIEVAPDGVIKSCNSLFFSVFECKRLEVIRKHLSTFIDENLTETLLNENYSENQSVELEEVTLFNPAGESFMCNVAASPIFNLKDELERVVLMLLNTKKV